MVGILSGLMQRYKESLKTTQGPILLSSIPDMKIDYRALIQYAQSKGVQPAELSEAEKRKFII